MTVETKIYCDRCLAKLDYTTNSIDYRLSLKCERIPCHDGAVTDMFIRASLDSDMHFCGLICLQQWAEGL